jgi:hypothetical protein
MFVIGWCRLVACNMATFSVGHIVTLCCRTIVFSCWWRRAVGRATMQHNKKSGYHQGKLPNRLQNVVKTHIAFYLNTINTLPTFYPTVNKPKLFTIFSKTAQVVEAHTMCPTFSASNGRWPYGCCPSCKKAKFFLKGFSNVDLIKMST